MKRTGLIMTLGVLTVITLNSNALKAQTNVYKLHSLFVYNFIKNIKWEDVNGNFKIGIYSNKNVQKEFMNNFDSKNFNGKPFNIEEINSSEDAKTCQIVYIPKASRSKTTALINALKGQHILVVTEEDLINEGASISFELVGSKLNFKINKSNTDRKGFKISSSLLALGTVI